MKVQQIMAYRYSKAVRETATNRDGSKPMQPSFGSWRVFGPVSEVNSEVDPNGEYSIVNHYRSQTSNFVGSSGELLYEVITFDLPKDGE